MNDLYAELILELNRNPLNKKLLADFDVLKREFNPICGDDITVRIKFNEAEQVADIGYEGVGCAISQAGASLTTEAVKGYTKEKIQRMEKEDVIRLFGSVIIPTRFQCALLALKAIQKTV
jgi:nitrogen fixation NifU-like protein